MKRSNTPASTQESCSRERRLHRAAMPFWGALTFLVTLIAARPAFTQVATGFPPLSTITPGPIDFVDNANLNVHLTIPVYSRAGRGPSFSYALQYDNSFWQSPLGAWTPSTTSSMGWSTYYEATMGLFAYGRVEEKCSNPAPPPAYYYYYKYSNWNYTDRQGTMHSFNLTLYDDAAENCLSNPSDTGTAVATDGSGYTLWASLAGTEVPSVTIHTPSGVAISPAVQALASAGTWTMQDPNGNQISSTTTSSGATITDTLGTALSVTYATTSTLEDVYQYTAPNSQPASVIAKYTPLTVQTNFGCPGITEYPATQIDLITEIDLPDIATNSTDKYLLSYESTPGVSGAVTGRIASVTLPTGGTISYVYSGGYNGMACADGTTPTLTRTTPDGDWTYAHTESGTAWTTKVTDPQSNYTDYDFQGIYETQHQVYNSSSSLMETVNTCYNGAAIPCTATAITLPISTKTAQVTPSGVSPSQTTTTFNTYGLPTETDEYAYGPTLERKTLVSYDNGNSCGVTNTYVVNRACSVTVENNAGATAASTTNAYDVKGNLLTQTLNNTGGTPAAVSRSFTYTANGVLATATDFNGNTTTYSNTSCNDAFPTTTNLPLSLSTSTVWNCNVGLPSSTTDANGKTTGFSYDSMLRLTNTSYPDGGSVGITHTSPNENDIYTAVTSSISRHDQIDLDGLGRVTTSALVNDPDGETYVGRSYDSDGRLGTVSNPYRSASSGGDTYSYDALNRVLKVAHADGTSSQTSYGNSATQNCSASTYGYGYPSLHTDESGNQRETFTDALGRVIEVDEPNSGGTLNVNTCYTYNVLNDRTGVIQGSETRTYGYDMLSRLTSASTPEAGTVNLYYTTSGGALCSGNPKAVCYRTDARGITTTYTYDALNRMTSRSYSNNNPTSITYYYDQTTYNGLTITNGKGRRTGMSDASGETGWSFDPMGRILVEQRTINSVTNDLAYTYNLDGSAATLTYPSGRAITYTVSAAQRPLNAIDTADSINYVSNATYAPQGAVAGALLGESSSFGGITYAATYTNRLLPSTVIASSSAGNVLNLAFGYYPNGNVQTITNNLNSARTQTFTYDNLNRVETAQSQATSGAYSWGQSFGYDRYANLLTATVTQGTAPALSLSVNTNNQITNSGFTFDASGDMTSDGVYSYTWDARQRLQSANGVTYTYDGDGKRVMKSSGTLYWNMPDGTPLAETNSSGSTVNEYIFFDGARTARRDSSGNVYFYFQDQLGTAKTLTTAAGTVCYDADFLPFGYENAYTTTCSQNYKFTGLERDSETGLDQTLHRKYDSRIGRWLTPDPRRGDPLNPQSWNRYVYVLDNPINLSDPYGLVNWSMVGWGAVEVTGGLLLMGASGVAELPTGGVSTITLISGGGASEQGVAKIIAGFTESQALEGIVSISEVSTNPAGLTVLLSTGSLNQATAAVAATGFVQYYGELGASGESGMQDLSNLIDFAQSAGSLLGYQTLFMPTAQTQIDVTATPDQISTVDVPVNSTLSDQDDNSGEAENGSGDQQDEGGAGGSGSGSGDCDFQSCGDSESPE